MIQISHSLSLNSFQFFVPFDVIILAVLQTLGDFSRENMEINTWKTNGFEGQKKKIYGLFICLKEMNKYILYAHTHMYITLLSSSLSCCLQRGMKRQF